MKNFCQQAIVLIAASLANEACAAITLPASAALPTNSVSNPGFVVRTAQASTNVVVANSFYPGIAPDHRPPSCSIGNRYNCRRAFGNAPVPA